MFIKKGSKLVVNDFRKGTFSAVATKDFDTEIDEFYPIACCERVVGLTKVWFTGDEIPARKSLCNISIVESEAVE
ncbi:MAG: hypothetical protein ACI4HZ_11095 [Ruminococcus sp.]